MRILHTYILDDPYPDPADLRVPNASPVHPSGRPPEEMVKARIPYEEDVLDAIGSDGRTAEEIEASIKRKEAYSRALVLEMTGTRTP